MSQMTNQKTPKPEWITGELPASKGRYLIKVAVGRKVVVTDAAWNMERFFTDAAPEHSVVLAWAELPKKEKENKNA